MFNPLNASPTKGSNTLQQFVDLKAAPNRYIYLGTGQTFLMAFFAKVVKGFQMLTILLKSTIIDVWQGPKHASGTQDVDVFSTQILF